MPASLKQKRTPAAEPISCFPSTYRGTVVSCFFDETVRPSAVVSGASVHAALSGHRTPILVPRRATDSRRSLAVAQVETSPVTGHRSYRDAHPGKVL